MLAGMGMATLPLSIWVIFLGVVRKTANKLHWTLLRTVVQAPLSYFSSTNIDLIFHKVQSRYDAGGHPVTRSFVPHYFNRVHMFA